MDLAKFAKMPPENGGRGAFLKFTPNDNVKIVRFCYEKTEDIQCRQKLYDPATKKIIWDDPNGKWTMSLKVAVYSDKNTFEIMTWDRSAVFGVDNLAPLFEAAGGRVLDTVYRITCTKAGTLDAKYSFFPLNNSKDFAMPELEKAVEDKASEMSDDDLPFSTKEESKKDVNTEPAPTKTTKSKKFWEE